MTREGKNVILCGPFGVGKSSLAGLYAQALQCDEITELGSPCRVCEQCKYFAGPAIRHPDTPRLKCNEAGRFDDIEGLIKSLRYRPREGRRRILILDEAQEASLKALAALLDILQTKPSWVTIIIVTSKIEEIGDAIISRCVRHDLDPIGFDSSVRWLKQICDEENIRYDASGLSLIAQTAAGNIRVATKRLEQLADNYDMVTETVVRKHFKLDYVDRLISWVRALISADLQQQIDVLDGWADRAPKKAAAIEAFLNFIHMTEVRRLYRQDIIMQNTTPDDRKFVVGAMAARAATAGIATNMFWQEAVEFWAPRAGGMTEATLLERAIKFNDWLNIGYVAEVAP
jgi:DNA polymerase III gamma/tau subunit